MAVDAGDRPLLERARETAARGAWEEAFDLFDQARRLGLVTSADLPEMAEVAYATGRLDVTVHAWEQAYDELLAAGRPDEAAGAAIRLAMHLLIDMALMAPVRAWLARAERLLPPDGETAADAWLAVARTYERVLSGDFESAHDHARRAIEVGSATDPAAAAIGRVAQARLVILDGDVDGGLVMLDEAGLAAISGQLDALSAGIVYCELVCALQGLMQHDRAEQWTEAMERWSRTHAVGSIRGRCRVHRAELLRLRGSFEEAEEQVQLAFEELRPYLLRELGWPLTELAQIRLRRGDLAGAHEAVAAAGELGWDADPGISLIHLAHGDLDAAAASIRDALARPTHNPSKELPPHGELRRAPLLFAQAEIAAAAGDLPTATAAADALEAIAARFGSKALSACACQARARACLLAGDVGAAIDRFSAAAETWSEVGAPYEVAIARFGLADAHRANGDARSAAREFDAARAIIGRIGGSTRDQEPRGLPRRSPGGANVFRREADYWTVVFEGHTTRLRDILGMRYVARLLAAPGRELHVLELVAAEHPGAPARGDASDSGELLDEHAKDAYRRRLAEIDEDLEDARRNHDEGRREQAEFERDFLLRELSRAVGLGGRARRAGSASERARASVTQAVRKALERLGDADPRLGEHLERTVRTGTYCAYLPDTRLPVDWQL